MAGEDARPNRSPSGIGMPTPRSEWDRTFLGFSIYEFGSLECGAPQSAAVLRALLTRCWNGSSQGLLFCCSFRKEECCSMRVHIDRKRLDGDAIAFVVIMLLIVIAFAY